MPKSVVADEPCEAASGCEAVVKSAFTVNLAHRVYWSCDRFALERSLVLLVNCYAVVRVAKFVAADEPCEAASGCEAVVKSAFMVNLAHRVYRFCDRFALEHSLVLLVSDYTRYTRDANGVYRRTDSTGTYRQYVRITDETNTRSSAQRSQNRYTRYA